MALLSNASSFSSTRATSGVAVALVLFLVLVVPLSCRPNKTPIEDRTGDALSGYSMYTENADLLVSDSGMTQYQLKAAVWYIYEEGDSARWYFPRGFQGYQVDSLMQVEAMLRADTAYYFTKLDQWLFVHNVVVENLSGDRFLAKTLRWESESKMVSSEDSVTVISEDRTLSGTSFRANQDFSKYTFLNNRGSISIKEDVPKEPDRQSQDTIQPPSPAQSTD